MVTVPRQPRYSSEEFAQRGDEIYERDIRSQLMDEDENRFVAIDIESGDYEVAPDELTATDAVFARHPDAQIWLRRIGSRPVYRFGHHRRTA